MIDEHLSWIDHINTFKNKLSKNLGLLYKAKPFLNAKVMKSLYFFFFHSYLTYGNTAWCGTSMTKFKKISSKQKQAIKTISITSLDYIHLKSEEVIDKLGILNIYKLNIHHTIYLMCRLKNYYHTTLPEAFRTKFQIVQHNYGTRHSKNNFEEPKTTFKITKFAISSRGLHLWNKGTHKF